MMDIRLCEKCESRPERGDCCSDIYQQLGHTKGPSVAGKAFLAFALPLLVFIASLILAVSVLSVFVAESATRGLYAFLIALVVTVLSVQFVRICTRKPITREGNGNKGTNSLSQ